MPLLVSPARIKSSPRLRVLPEARRFPVEVAVTIKSPAASARFFRPTTSCLLRPVFRPMAQDPAPDADVAMCAEALATPRVRSYPHRQA
jgi:hypothetical protein